MVTGIDKAEGLGYRYNEKYVTVFFDSGESIQALTYYANRIN